MKKTIVIDVVGLTPRLIGPHTPFLKEWSEKNTQAVIKPILPAVTCSAQSTYVTGKMPAEHGIVGNGWYFKDEHEIKFWRQSNQLVQAPKVWELAREKDPNFTVSKMFWWYNMYSSADFSVTPRPNYLSNGLKIPDVYSYPADLRDKLQEKLGPFPLFNFWGPNTNIKSSQWIADATLLVDQWQDPTLTLVYLPHLDYNIQRHGVDHSSVYKDLNEIDAVCQGLIEYYEKQGARIILLSEYGITNVSRPIHLNRIFRKKGWLGIRWEQTWELLDAGASDVFAVADHQIAHVYVKDKSKLEEVKIVLETTDGVELVLGEEGKAKYQLNHDRAGDFVVVADKDSWFTYYFWLDDQKAPDYARTVDIHKKPGYDPVEMFLNPKFPIPLLAVLWRLVKKKLGFRYMMDVIPLDPYLVKGSHGRIPEDQADYPIWMSNYGAPNSVIEPTAVQELILKHLQGD